MSDAEHFATYRHQTKLKHTILEKYLKAFFEIVAPDNKNLVYIDGFAGPGEYTTEEGKVEDGSPIRALRVISQSPNFCSKVTTLFIEKDRGLFKTLETAVSRVIAENPKLRPPSLENSEFAEVVLSTLTALADQGGKLAPGFLFVDPCGVAGTSFAAIQRFLSESSSEALIFFNLNAVRRIVGLGDASRETLPCLLGSEERALALIERVGRCQSPDERENTIINFYRDLLRSETRARFVTLFRIEREDRRTTSHYLIHVTSHRMGFRLMKDVMWRLGETREGRGAYALEQASLSDQGILISQRDSEARRLIIQELSDRPRKVAFFDIDLPGREHCLVAPPHFKEILLRMENSGEIQVLSKDDGSKVVLASERKKHKQKATLGKDYWVRLTPQADRS